MKRITAVILALLLMLSAAAETAGTGSVTLAFDANITTGYEWSAFVMGGDSVKIDQSASGYVSDPNPEMADGVGGTHYFKIDAVKPGNSIIIFTLLRSLDEGPAARRAMLITVDDSLNIYCTDVSGSGVIEGTAESVDAEAREAVLVTEEDGKLTAVFDGSAALPSPGERVIIYTDGTLTKSLPPRANVICWESVPSGAARAADTDYTEAVITQIADTLAELASDSAYINLLGLSGQADEYISLYASCRDARIVSCRELACADFLSFITDETNEYEALSEAGKYMLSMKIYSGQLLSNIINNSYGVAAAIAGSLSCSLTYDLGLPSALYLAEYDNGAGIIAGIWNDGCGINTVSAHFIPDASIFAGETDILKLLENLYA